MSLEAIIWALRDAKCTPAEKLVLAVLCNWIDEHTDCSWPSVDTIKDWTGQSDRTIGRAINRLEASGIVARPEAQQRRKGRFAQNVLHIGLHGPAVPPTPAVIDACLEIMRHRRRSPSVKLTHGDGSPSAKMTHGDGQNDRHRPSKCRPVSIEDPVSFSDKKTPVRGGRAAPRAGDTPARRDRKGPRPTGLAGQLADLHDAIARHNPGQAKALVAPLTVDGDVVKAPSKIVLQQIQQRLLTDFRIYGIDVDRIEVATK